MNYARCPFGKLDAMIWFPVVYDPERLYLKLLHSRTPSVEEWLWYYSQNTK